MKKIIAGSLLLFLYGSLAAQTVSFSIQGTLKEEGKAKYIYMYSTYGQQVFSKYPIQGNAFTITGKAELEGEFYKTAILFIDERGDISADEVKSKLDQQIWMPGRTPQLKIVVLEDMELEIPSSDRLNELQIVSGGILSRQYGEAGTAASQRKTKEFIEKHADSPVSLYILQPLIKLFDIIPERDHLINLYGEPKQLYALLSDRLKNSKQGMALKKAIDELD
jgi:hypothetical protein